MPGTVEQREQAVRELKTKNRKDIFELPDELKIAGEPVRIFNVGPFRHQKSLGSYGQWTIQACEPGFKFVIGQNEDPDSLETAWDQIPIERGEIAYSRPTEVPYITNDPIHVDMFQMAHRHDSGRKLAADILGVGQFHTPSEDLRKWGCFISAGPEPSHEELRIALAALNRTYDALIMEADGYWNSGPNMYENITDMHRNAARERRQMGKPWARAVVENKPCPICASGISPEAAVCPHCKTVIDEAKVIKMKVPGYEHLWDKRKKNKAEEKDEEADSNS